MVLRTAQATVAVAGTALLMTAGLAVSPAAAAAPSLSPVAHAALMAPGNGMSDSPTMSGDGRFIAFISGAADLVAGDTNERDDIFLRDTQSGLTRRISVSGTGEQANDYSFEPQISTDGRFVAYTSAASNLVTGDTNNETDTFLHDTQTGAVTRVNVGSDGRQDSQGSAGASISATGRFVAFQSVGSYLVPGDTNYVRDVFVRDTQLNTTTRVSVSSAGAQADDRSAQPRISADGRFVAFVSDAMNLVTGDTNNESDVFLRDTKLKTTTRVNVNTAGKQADDQMFSFGSQERPAISPDGRFVAFTSWATNLTGNDNNQESDLFVRDTQAKTTTMVSVSTAGGQANGFSGEPAFSSDGRYIAFVSGGSSLVSGDTNNANDIFLRDTKSKTTTRVNVDAAGKQANNYSDRPVISADGRFVAFHSEASNLVSADTNSGTDVFLRDRQGATQLVSVAAS